MLQADRNACFTNPSSYCLVNDGYYITASTVNPLAFECKGCELEFCKKCSQAEPDKCLECAGGLFYSEIENKCVVTCTLPESPLTVPTNHCKIDCIGDNCKDFNFWSN